jgi:nicotinate-nucleotide adenylyltransferase
MQRIAFFGGTFDPPHRGHLAIAKAAADRFELDQVLFAPVASQPLKASIATSFLHRYTMTAIASQADPRFIPSMLDASLPQAEANYTVNTLARLRSAFPKEIALFTLLGADSWLQIAHWHKAVHLLSMSDWIVAARPGFSLAAASHALPSGVVAEEHTETSLLLRHPNATPTYVFFLPDMQENISATALRDSLCSGHLAPEMLPASVEEYIRKTHLYDNALG